MSYVPFEAYRLDYMHGSDPGKRVSVNHHPARRIQ